MFDGKIAVFNRLYQILHDEYRGGDSERQVFNTVERSFVLRDVDNLDPKLFPWLFLMWGRSEPTDAPRTGEFAYNFEIPVIVMTYADDFKQEGLSVNPDAARNTDEQLIVPTVEVADQNENPGVGDLEVDVVRFVWDGYKPQFITPTAEYVVRDWWLGDTEPPRLAPLQILQISPFVRMMQINFIFTIVEFIRF